jgi:hypothetical protein
MTDKEVMQQALEALESSRIFVITREKTKHPEGTEWYDSAITALKAALEQPQQEQMRMPKAGDKVICLEDESIGEIVSLTAGGSPDIAFDDGSRGTYMVNEFAKLFGYVTPPAAQPEQVDCPECKAAVLYECMVCSSNNYPPKPEQEPVAIPDCGEAGHADGACGTSECLPSFRRKTTPPAAQRPWVGLTEEEIGKAWLVADGEHNASASVKRRITGAIEAKLKERNT